MSLGNDLDDSGERYCHSTGPDFSYNSEIQVLFRSNLDPVVSTGFECEVVAQPVEFEEQPALPTITNPPPRVSSFAQEACTDVTVSGGHNHRKNFIIQFKTQNPHLYFKPIMSKSCKVPPLTGATSTTPVVLAAGEGRQFTSPGFDGISGYAAESKCLWTFAPATGATLSFSCSAFSITSTAAVGERCAGE